MSVSSSSWCLGRAAACDCGTPGLFSYFLRPQATHLIVSTDGRNLGRTDGRTHFNSFLRLTSGDKNIFIVIMALQKKKNKKNRFMRIQMNINDKQQIKIVSLTQRAHDVNITSPQRRCNVMTLRRRYIYGMYTLSVRTINMFAYLLEKGLFYKDVIYTPRSHFFSFRTQCFFGSGPMSRKAHKGSKKCLFCK